MTDRVDETRFGAPTGEIDGVPVFWGPHPEGQYSAGLMFRVGRADETLARSGITHLVEHLALHEHGMSDLHFNGSTDDLITHFYVHGTAEQVTDYLHGVCAGLRDLPLHRLETEKRLLANEADGRHRSISVLYRHGAQGHGLPAYPELGLQAIGAPDVVAWAARHFTRGNAALWISGERVPEGLHLDLPDGPRIAPPPVTTVLPSTPAWFGASENAVIASGILARSAATQVFSEVLGRALFRDLRQRDGISYRASSDYVPLDTETATVWAYADCSPDQRAALVGAYADTLARLRFRGPTASELEAAIGAVTTGLRDPAIESHRLPSLAVSHLVGRLPEPTHALIAETEAVTTQDVMAMARRFHDTSVVQVPANGLDWAGHVRAPELSTGIPVDGRRLSASARGGTELVLGQGGVSRHEGGGHATVRFDAVAALLRHPDGGRELIGLDGVRVPVEPTLTRISSSELATLDGAVGESRIVDLPARRPEDVPRPRREAKPRRRRSSNPVVRWLRVIAVWALLLLAALLAVSGVTLVVDQGDWAAAILSVMIAGLFLGLALMLGGFLSLPWRRRSR